MQCGLSSRAHTVRVRATWLTTAGAQELLDVIVAADGLSDDEKELMAFAVSQAQRVVSCLVVLFLSFLCIGSLHRTASLIDLWRHCKWVWLIASLVAIFLQVPTPMSSPNTLCAP